MSASRNVARLATQTIRNVSTSTARQQSAAVAKEEIPAGYKQLRDIQSKFQSGDGKPVHLKGGAFDTILFQVTMVGCLIGIGGMGKLFYDLSRGKE